MLVRGAHYKGREKGGHVLVKELEPVGPFKTARRRNVSDDIVRRIEGLVVRGEAPAGSRLPSEREMAEQFGVGRSTVREALRTLAREGLVEIRPGKGIFFADYLARATLDFVGAISREEGGAATVGVMGEILEFRRIVEVPMAGLATERADRRGFRILREVLEEEEACLGDPNAFTEVDYRFHRALAELSGNRIFLLLLNSVGPVQTSHARLYFAAGGTGRVAEVHRFHRKIAAAVEAGDGEGASLIMAHMLDEGARGMEGIFAGEK